MKSFLLRRLFQTVVTLFVLTLISFFLLRLLPGDPLQQILGERGGSKELVEQMRGELGLDKPLVKQYWIFLSSAFKGDFGFSLITRKPVLEEFLFHFPATLELSFFALLWALLLGLPLGFYSALKENQFVDRVIMIFSLLGFSMSVFWWGLMLILIFSVTLTWTPVSGRIDLLFDVPSVTGFYLIDVWFLQEGRGAAFLSALKHLLLPSLTLATIPLAFITRVTRFSFLDVFQMDYIKTARAKGLSFYQVFFKHAFFNALIPILTVTGVLLGTLITGAVLTETVFSWPGIGQWFVRAVLSRDYPVITGGVLLLSFIVVGINTSVDLIYMKIDPRMEVNMLKDKI